MEDLAYTAGIIDGEGSIGVSLRKATQSYHLMVQVSMKLPTIIPKWLLTNFGGNYGEYKQSKRAYGEGIIAKWSIHGTAAQEFILSIYPYLMDKKDQAEVALVFPISHKGRRNAEYDIQSVCYDRLRQLKR